MNLNTITITEICDVSVVSSPKGRFAKMENRASYGLSFCIDGQITYTHNQKNIVSDKSSAIFLPQGQTYTLTGDKTGSFSVINFTCNERLCDTVVALPIQSSSGYIREFNKLMTLSLFEGNRAEMMSVLYHILHSLSLESSVCKTIIPAIKYIEENYHAPNISIDFLAQRCNISEVYFRQLFKKQYQTTPHQFITDIRIKKAEQLLAEGSMKIYAIAEKCGFSNQYHFSRMFKKITGFTPVEYRKLNENTEI